MAALSADSVLRKPWPARREALLLALGALLLYSALGQNVLYGRDAHVLLVRAAQGTAVHNHHLTYFPLLAVLRLLGEPLGQSLHSTARLYSALGTAAGVALLHLAARRLGLGRGQALAASALAAVCPAVMLFATVVEVHGPFYAFSGLASFAAAACVARPRTGQALLLGGALGLAYCAHATGSLLGCVLLPLVLAWPSAAAPALQQRMRLCAIALLVQGILIAGVSLALRAYGIVKGEADAAGLIAAPLAALTSRPGWVLELPRLWATEAWKEWLWPMLPLSFTVLLGLWRPLLRARVLLLLLGLVPYLALAVVLLTPYPQNSEHGAYLLPVVWPAALLTALAWPCRATLWIALASLVLGVITVKAHDRHERVEAWDDGLRAVAGDRKPFLLVGDYADLEALHVQRPDVAFGFLSEWIGQVPAPLEAAFLERLDQRIADQQRAGDAVYLTRGVVDWMEQPDVKVMLPLAPRALAHLRARWQLVPRHASGFGGFEVVAR